MKKSNSLEAQVERALAKARTALSEKGVATATQMGTPKIRPIVFETLLQEGFEATGKKVRVPLEKQASVLLSEGAILPLNQLHKHLAGTTTVEAKKLAKTFHADARGRIIVRGKERSLVASTQTTLDGPLLAKLSRELAEGAKWLKSANTKTMPGTVLLADLLETFDEWRALLPQPSASPSSSDEGDDNREETNDWNTLLGFLRALQDEDSGLISVPLLAKRAAEDAPHLDLKRELLQAFRAGLLELRPEGGIGRLSPDDAALCPLGAGGLPLSWARLLGEAP